MIDQQRGGMCPPSKTSHLAPPPTDPSRPPPITPPENPSSKPPPPPPPPPPKGLRPTVSGSRFEELPPRPPLLAGGVASGVTLRVPPRQR